MILVDKAGTIAKREDNTHKQSHSELSNTEFNVSMSLGEGMKVLWKELAQVGEELAAEKLLADVAESELASTQTDARDIKWLKEALVLGWEKSKMSLV